MSASVPPTISAIRATVRSIIGAPVGLRAPRRAPPGRRTATSVCPPRVCPVSWPLPAIDAPRHRPPPSHRVPIASRRSPISTTCASVPACAAPARISRRIAAGSSLRGLSSVTTTRSASFGGDLAPSARVARVAVAAGAEHHRSRRSGAAQGWQHRLQRARACARSRPGRGSPGRGRFVRAAREPGSAAVPLTPARGKPRPRPASPAATRQLAML